MKYICIHILFEIALKIGFTAVGEAIACELI